MTGLRGRLALLLAAAVGATGFAAMPSAQAADGAISGSVFQDLDRDGVQDPGEAGFSGVTVYLTDAAYTYTIAAATTAADGSYAFPSQPGGDYLVEIALPNWRALRDAWAPTTTPDLRPRHTVRVDGTSTAMFGWRPITRSRDLAAPVTRYVGPSGLTVASYNDVVTARAVYDLLSAGELIGPEAAVTTIRLDYSSSSYASTPVGGGPGDYANYSATVYLSWEHWLERRDEVLFHEYGHAWSMYYDYLVQQDGRLQTYLDARGLGSDSRLETSHMWSRGEMIAEDYRQLFGSPAARAVRQENYQIARAEDVPGLRNFLATTFRSGSASPTPTPTTTPTTSPTPTATATAAPAPLAVTNLSMNPAPVRTSGVASFELSRAASVTVSILDSRGKIVRRLATSVARAAGPASFPWDRTGDDGRRVKAGTYRLSATAADDSGSSSAAAAFTVS